MTEELPLYKKFEISYETIAKGIKDMPPRERVEMAVSLECRFLESTSQLTTDELVRINLMAQSLDRLIKRVAQKHLYAEERH